jgi:hypothetical protein
MLPSPTGGYPQDGTGRYYTCPIAQGINRAIGSMDINFYVTSTNDLYCSLLNILTRPDDWDPWTEGLPWQEPGSAVSNPMKSFSCNAGFGVDSGIDTALGCIPYYTPAFTPWIISRAIMIAGGLAFLLMIYAGFQILIASGNPERIMAGQELLKAALSGLLLIIFAIFLLNLVGFKVFKIPGLQAPSPGIHPGTIVIPNAASRRSCTDVCRNDYNGRTCLGISTRQNLIDRKYWQRLAQVPPLPPICSRLPTGTPTNDGCGVQMADQNENTTGNECEGHETYWSWCFCQ